MVIRAANPNEMPIVRRLFIEYAETLGFSLCFQGFQQELDQLPGCYGPPGGILHLAMENNDAIGVVGLRRHDEQSAEMKRLYVQPVYRGKTIGRKLVEAVIHEARLLGYYSIKLDTVPTMVAARQLYEQMGFQIIPSYYQNSECQSICMELLLK